MAETIIINNFTQGGFYVNNGEEYSSSTEIKSGWVDVPGASKITVNSGIFKWSFGCADANGNFREISESLGYKDSETVIDLSAYPWIKSIRIELHDDNGIVPPQTCELVFEFTWYMGDDGLPTTDDFLPFPDNPLADELPKMLWRITPGVNNGLPYHELLPLEKPSEGAFMNAYNLEYAYIPRSCKKIGEFAFTNTKLRRVRISADCQYYPTSFPKGCEIEFYNESG